MVQSLHSFKKSSRLKNITLFIIFGLILITIGFYFNDKYKEFSLITELNIWVIYKNILQGNSLKEIELYNELLINLSKKNDHKSRTLIAGVIKRF